MLPAGFEPATRGFEVRRLVYDPPRSAVDRQHDGGGRGLMPATPTQRPDDASLAAGLGALLNAGGCAQGYVAVVEREPNVYASSYASDIDRCRLPQGDELRLLCK